MQKLNVSEKEVQAVCLEYLALKGYFFFRLNNMPVWDYGEHRYRAMPKYTPPGLPDCVMLAHGTFVGFEFKGSSGKVSDEQFQCHQKIREAGGKVYLVRSLDEMQVALKELGL